MDRKEEIINYRKKGWSYKTIGVVFNISGARVHQILSGYRTDTKLKQFIFNRDGYCCQYPMCDKKDDNMVLHHLNSNDRDNKYDNLITVHRHCHTKYHMLFDNKQVNGHKVGTKLRNCLTCGKEIVLSKKCCSKECRKIYTQNKGKRVCEECKKEYTVTSYVHKSRWCSKKCQGKWLGDHYGFK